VVTEIGFSSADVVGPYGTCQCGLVVVIGRPIIKIIIIILIII